MSDTINISINTRVSELSFLFIIKFQGSKSVITGVYMHMYGSFKIIHMEYHHKKRELLQNNERDKD